MLSNRAIRPISLRPWALPPGLGHDGDCPVNRSVVRAALSLFQQERQSDITLNAGSRNKGVRKAGHLTCSSRVLPCRQAAGVLKHRIGNIHPEDAPEPGRTAIVVLTSATTAGLRSGKTRMSLVDNDGTSGQCLMAVFRVFRQAPFRKSDRSGATGKSCRTPPWATRP